MVAVAIGGAALIGAGSTLVAGSKAAKAQKNAAATAAEASSNATRLQVDEARRQYDQTRDDFAPQRQVGYGALGKLAGMYGVTPTNADGTPVAGGAATGMGYQGDGGFTASPGYQFRLDQGVQAATRSAAARGSLASGGTLKAIQRYGEGLAASEYDVYASRLAQLAGVGQAAQGSTAAAGAQASSTIAGAYGANGRNQADAATAAGDATASAYANTGSAINGGVQNLASLYLRANSGFGTPNAYGIAGSGGVI